MNTQTLKGTQARLYETLKRLSENGTKQVAISNNNIEKLVGISCIIPAKRGLLKKGYIDFFLDGQTTVYKLLKN